MAEIYGRSDGLCGGYGGSMHLVDPERGFLGTSGIVGQAIPHATGAGMAAQLDSRQQSCSASSATAPANRARSRVAEPRVAVEAARRLHHGEQRLQRCDPHDQEDANAAAGEPLSSRRRPTRCPV